MKISNAKKTIAAFETQAIKTDQQLTVKGGDGGSTSNFIGSDDLIMV